MALLALVIYSTGDPRGKRGTEQGKEVEALDTGMLACFFISKLHKRRE